MEADYEELYKWIEEHTITRPKRNINRDFSDALPLVEILKQHFPKLVHLHNYSPKNSHSQKLINWETLNNKVLKKIKMNLTKKRMDQLANAEPGAIERLLLEIKKRIESHSAGDESSGIIYLEEDTNSMKPAKAATNKQTISRTEFEKMQAEIVEKGEAITILKNKVDHLESLLDIKEERIKDLNQQLQAIVNQSSNEECPQPTKFFSLF